MTDPAGPPVNEGYSLADALAFLARNFSVLGPYIDRIESQARADPAFAAILQDAYRLALGLLEKYGPSALSMLGHAILHVLHLG